MAPRPAPSFAPSSPTRTCCATTFRPLKKACAAVSTRVKERRAGARATDLRRGIRCKHTLKEPRTRSRRAGCISMTHKYSLSRGCTSHPERACVHDLMARWGRDHKGGSRLSKVGMAMNEGSLTGGDADLPRLPSLEGGLAATFPGVMCNPARQHPEVPSRSENCPGCCARTRFEAIDSHSSLSKHWPPSAP